MRFKRLNKLDCFHYSILFLTLIIFLFQSSIVLAGEDDIRRRVAFKLFRATLAADTRIDEKTTEGKLTLGLIYSGNSSIDKLRAESFLQQFQTNLKLRDIHNNPVQVELLSEADVMNPKNSKQLVATLSGLYLLDDLAEDVVKKITQLAIDKQIISFSPFKGHVEFGILGGLSVEAKVRPYINMKTLEESGILLKPFFLKVIKRYEP